MTSSIAGISRELIQNNCLFLSTFASKHGYLNLPENLCFTIDRTVAQVDERLKSDQLRLALVGGFSAGKSTLINAMLQDRILTSRPSPTTICPTYISYGPSNQIIITVRTLPRGASTIESALPEKVWLTGRFISGRAAQMETSSGVEYSFAHTFRKRGFYNYRVYLDATRTVSGRVYVPENNMQVVFMYNLLTNSTATSVTCCAIPESKLPIARINSYPGTPQIVLRDIWLDMRWEGITCPLQGQIDVSVDFDGKWFDSRFPVRYAKRSNRSLLQRLRMWFQPSYRFVKIAGNSKTCKLSTESWRYRDAAKHLVRLDLNNNTFTVQFLEENEFVTRVFNVSGACSRGAKMVAALTAATRDSSDKKDYSDVITKVAIHHPSQLLRRGLVLIDTPGIESNADQTAQTIEIIQREADACLFLCPAEQAGTLSDLDFIKEHVMSSVGDIIFVLTKADKADSPEELEELVDNLRSKVATKLKLPNCMIQAVSAQEALSDSDSEAYEQFLAFVDDVFSFTQRNRDVILARRLAKIEAAIMSRLKEAADEARINYEAKRATLRSYVIEDLNMFVEREQRKVFKQFETAFDLDEYADRLMNLLSGVVVTWADKASDIVYSAPNINELKKVCESQLTKCFHYMGKDLEKQYREYVKQLQNEMPGLVQKVFEDFDRSFEQQYPLTRLTGHRILFNLGKDVDISRMSVHGEIAKVNQAIASESNAGAAGASIGTLLGTIVLPGVGSVIGGVLGYFASKLFAPSLDSVKASVMSDINSKLGALISDDIPLFAYERTYELEASLLDTLSVGIGEYITQYKSTIDQLIYEHDQKKRKVNSFIIGASKVAAELRDRISELKRLERNLIPS